MRSPTRFSAFALLAGAPLLAPTLLAAAVIVVNTRTDAVAPGDGRCTLREAITAANLDLASGGAAGECAAGSAAPTRDTIRFVVAGTIRPSAANGQLPPIAGGYTTIDGWTAPGAAPGARPRIVLDGQLVLPPYEIGIYLVSPHNIVRGLAIVNFADFGVYVETSDAHHNWIAGNRIGTSPNGLQARPNGFGIVIQLGAHDNLVGTDGDGVRDAAEGNLVSGNLGDGMSVGDYGNRIAGNRIGLNGPGNAALANGANGIITQLGSTGIVIGTDGDGSPGDGSEGNVVSGHLASGVYLAGLGGHVVAGNRIGLDAAGSFAVGNSIGITVEAGTDLVRIGTDGDGISDALERNVVSGNSSAGILLYGSDHWVAGNFVGTDATGTVAVANDHGISAPLDASLVNGGTTIGGVSDLFRNVIAGNLNTGVFFGALDVIVQCNSIGTDAGGTIDLGGQIGVNALGSAANALVRENRVAFNEVGIDAWTPSTLVEENLIVGNDLGLNWFDPGTLDAENNWWGDASGPTDAGNPGGLGDSVVTQAGGTIDYDPWLVAEPVPCVP